MPNIKIRKLVWGINERGWHIAHGMPYTMYDIIELERGVYSTTLTVLPDDPKKNYSSNFGNKETSLKKAKQKCQDHFEGLVKRSLVWDE